MLHPRRHAAALLAVLALSLPASAVAGEPVLLAQIEDATPTPTPEPQPPLSEDPPGLEDGDQGDGPGPEETTPADDGESLPDTGLDAALVALLGAGLIASGSGLRLTLGRDDAR